MKEQHGTVWPKERIFDLFNQPFFELVAEAHLCHKVNFDLSDMEFATLSSIKTGRCPEDCAYCPQSGHYHTGLKTEPLLDKALVVAQAQAAKNSGATRFCMGAAWKNPPKKDFPKVLDMVTAVKNLGLETCVTLGTLDQEQAEALKEAGLDFYNHNLDTSPDYYKTIISTRNYEERLETLEHVSSAGINVCCGGILGMGETRDDRVMLLHTLSQLTPTPQSIPINQLIPIPGTPLEHADPVDSFEFIRTIAVTRIMFPKARVRLSAGRKNMSHEMQAWCFMAGANSVFLGDKLLTAPNQEQDQDEQLFKHLGITPPKKKICAHAIK